MDAREYDGKALRSKEAAYKLALFCKKGLRNGDDFRQITLLCEEVIESRIAEKDGSE